MSPSVVLVANLAVAVTLLAGTAVPSGRRGVTALAALPLVSGALLVAFVFGEDDYRHGVSRWNAYRSPGGALGAMFVASVVLLVVCSLAIAFFGARGRGTAARVGACAASVVALLLVTPTIIGFSTN